MCFQSAHGPANSEDDGGEHDCEDGRKLLQRQCPADAPDLGEQAGVEQIMAAKPERCAEDAAENGVSRSFARDHARKLLIRKPEGAEHAVLTRTRADAHGDAVDHIKHGNKSDHGKKSVDEKRKAIIRAAGAGVRKSIVDESHRCSCLRADGVHICVAGAWRKLEIDDAVGGLAGEGAEGLLARDERAEIAVTDERRLANEPDNGHLLLLAVHCERKLVADGQRSLAAVLVINSEHGIWLIFRSGKITCDEIILCPGELTRVVACQIDGAARIVACRRKIAGEHAPVSRLDDAIARKRVEKCGINRAGIVAARDGNIRRPWREGTQRALHHVNSDGKSQKEDDAEGKRAGHEQEIFAAGARVVNAEGGLHAQMPRRRSGAHWQLIGGVTADSDERRHLRSAFRWCARSDEHRRKSEHDTGDDRRHTHAERRHFRKILRREMAQHGAEDPDQHHAHDHPAGNRETTPAQRFPAHEPHHLLRRRAETAQHAVKFCTLSNARVQARGDHEHTGDEHQHAEHDRCEIDLHHRRARALSVEAEELHVFHDLIVGKIHVRFEIADRLPREKRMRKLHIEPAVHIVEVDVRKRLRVHPLCFGVHLAESLRREKGAKPIGRHRLRAVLAEAADGARNPAAIRRSDGHRIADLHAVDIPRVLRQHDVVCAFRKVSVVDGIRDDLCHHRFVTAGVVVIYNSFPITKEYI